MLLNLPEGRRSSELIGLRAPPNSPVSASRAVTAKSKSDVIVGTAGVILLISVFVVVAGLVGALALQTAVYFSVVLTAVAGALLLGAWRGGHLQLSAAARADEQSQMSFVCVAEVAVDTDTQLTVRSWWPADLEVSQVRANGTRVAMENAERWLTANRGQPVPEISFDESRLPAAISEHICAHDACAISDQQCAVCFDDFAESPACRLRLCGHGVHAECLAAWFKTSNRATCPMCRCDHSALLPADVKREKRNPTASLRLLHVRVQRAALPSDIANAQI